MLFVVMIGQRSNHFKQLRIFLYKPGKGEVCTSLLGIIVQSLLIMPSHLHELGRRNEKRECNHGHKKWECNGKTKRECSGPGILVKLEKSRNVVGKLEKSGNVLVEI